MENRKPQGDDALEALRERVYAREENVQRTRTARYERPHEVVASSGATNTDWNIPDLPPEPPVPAPKKRSLRTMVIMGGVAFFLVSSIVASLMLVFGNQDISANNIKISTQAPFAVGGGEEARITVSVQNNNAVAITDATLIVEYPNGTEIDGTRARELTVKRYALSAVARGESVNTELRPHLFGEEHDEKEIKISLEYHVAGSAATFYRESDSVRVQISSSPVSIVLDSVSTITSGQEYVLTATIISNSDTELRNVLVSAAYPRTFDVKRVEPTAVAGRNTWRIDSLKPGEQTKITIVGVLSGAQQTIQAIDVSVGLASDVNTSKLASVLSTARTEVLIEAPFLGIDLSVNQKTGETISLPLDTTVTGSVRITNTLPNTIYDVALTVHLAGSAYSPQNLSVQDGYFDVGANTITFDKIEDSRLAQMAPGETREMSFSLTPNTAAGRTPEINLSIDAAAARTSNTSATRDLSAAQSMNIRFVSSMAGFASIEPGEGPYPPHVGKETHYKATFSVEGGGNEYVGVGLTALVPRGVSIIGDLPAGVVWDASVRKLTWTIGALPAGASKQVQVTFGHTPTTLDVGSVPTIVQAQTLSGTDRFTKDVVTITLPALTTETGDSGSSGQVRE